MQDDDETTVRKHIGPGKAVVGAQPYIVLLQGASIGRVFRVRQGALTIGRSLDADIQLDDDGVSRMHARVERRADEIRLVDLDSTNGTFVNGVSIRTRTLADGDVLQLGKNAVLKFTLQTDVEGKYSEQLYEAATRDALTGLLNRRFFDDQLTKDFAHAIRHGAALSVVMLDIDHFKPVNDTHGHVAGDLVLAGFGEIVREGVRTEDVACRLGGEEFAVLMRDTGWDGARATAERLRLAIANHAFDLGARTIKVTTSAGVATFDPAAHPTAQALVAAADQALYQAKREGRNRVAAGPRPTQTSTSTNAPPDDLKATRG